MKRLRPAELAKRLAETLEDSPDARERLLARILHLHIPHLSARKAGPRNDEDRELAYLVVAGVREGVWPSDTAACDWLAEKGAIGGITNVVDSRSSRLRQFISKQRDFIDAIEDLSHLASRTFTRLLAARLVGQRPGADPEFAARAEKFELEDLAREVEKSIEADVDKARIAIKEAAETVRILVDSARASRQIK